jgi:hypothetical protein
LALGANPPLFLNAQCQALLLVGNRLEPEKKVERRAGINTENRVLSVVCMKIGIAGRLPGTT